MRKSRKEQLLKAAFKIFMTKQYEGVRIDDIQEACGMSRGAIFYHAKTKEELYKQVVERYIMSMQDINKKNAQNNASTLREYIDVYIDGISKNMKDLRASLEQMPIGNASRAYIATLLNVCNHFPDLRNQYLLILNNDTEQWIKVIEEAIAKGEIKEDIEVQTVARTFICMFYGASVVDSISFGLNTSQLKNQMLYYYEFIKK